LRQLELRLGLGLDALDLLFDALEGVEGALVLEAGHRLLDGPLGVGPGGARDDQVLLALGLLDLVVEHPQGALELIDRGLLLLPLLFVLLVELVVLLLALERLLREAVVALADGEHGPALPLGGVGALLLGLLREVLLVGDGNGDLLLRVDELTVHLEDDLVQHLLGVFGPADQVIEVGLDKLGEAGEHSHDD
jgi:hypothetical protein